MDPIIQQEAEILINVLNKMFNEDDRGHFIGVYRGPGKQPNNFKANLMTNNPSLYNLNNQNFAPSSMSGIENLTNPIVEHINIVSKNFNRQNKGVTYKVNRTYGPLQLPSRIHVRHNHRVTRKKKHSTSSKSNNKNNNINNIL